MKLLGGVAQRAVVGVDQLVGLRALEPLPSMRSRRERLGHEARIDGLQKIRDFYASRASELLPAPPPIAPEVVRRRTTRSGGEVVDLRWPSGFEPLWEPYVRERYLRNEANRWGWARAFLHREPRPTALLLHAYMGGWFPLDERVWPVRWLYRHGLDVVLGVLPLHGPRRRSRLSLEAPPFPSSDPRFTIEGMRQVAHDQVGLMDYLVSRRGAPAVGVMGMSLGGYTAAFLATVDPRLAFAVPVIPLGSIATFAARNGRLVGDAEQQRAQREHLDAAMAVASPLGRPPCIAPERVMVVAGEADHVTGLEHARALADHFGAPLVTFAGGHIVQLGRDGAFARVGRFLDELGLWS